MGKSVVSDRVDCLVVGSGAAAMTAALAAKSAGLQPEIIEKTECFGGTTAVSGGVLWVPNNTLMRRLGDEDSAEDALQYMRACIGNRVAAPDRESVTVVAYAVSV